MPIDPKMQAMATMFFGKCDLALTCKTCKKPIVTKAVTDVLALDDKAFQTLGMKLAADVAAHKCG